MRIRGKEGEEGVQEESRVRGEVEKEEGRNTSQSTVNSLQRFIPSELLHQK